MAMLKSENEEVELTDGSTIMKAADKLGVPFGCHSGMCATCQVLILEGMSNLGPLTQAELDMELEPGVRLACQARIKKGVVKIRF